MTEPKKPNLKGIDISKLSRVRPTRVPSALQLNQNRPHKTNYRKLAIHAGILAAIILIAYGASVIGAFVFNDHYVDNFLGIKFSEESFWSNLFVKAVSQPLSQPWITASFAYDLQNFVFDPSWYHIVNLILHFLSCFYFYLLVYSLARYFWQDDGKNEPVHEVALVASALLACHPLAAESVAHIVGRQASLTACNFFLTLNFFIWSFLTTNTRAALRNYLLTFVFLAQAVFCGVQTLAIPAIMLLMSVLFKPFDFSLIEWFKHKWAELVIVVFLLVVIPLAAVQGFTADFSNGFVSPLMSWQIYVASQFRSLVAYYLRCFVLPLGVSIFPPFSRADNFFDPLALLGMLVLGGAAYAIYRFRKRPLLALGLAIAVFSYLPLLFFVQNEIVADWRFYIPLAGLSLMIADLVKPWLFDWRASKRVKAIGLALVLVLLTLDVFRSLDFHTDTTLFKSAIRVNKDDALAQGMLSLALVKERKTEQGVELAKKTIALDKNCQPAYLALGRAFTPIKKNSAGQIPRLKQAEIYFEQALALAKSQHLGILILFETERDLGSVLANLGEYKRAKDYVQDALDINPNSVMLNLTMGKIYNDSGDYLKALIHLNKVYERDRLNPDFVEPLIEAELGVASPQLISAAYNTAKMGIVVVPTHKLRLLLAQSALATGHLNESIQFGKAALDERPEDPSAQYLYSLVLKAAGQHKSSQELKAKALAADPNLLKKMKVFVLNKDRNAIISLEERYPLAIK